jgi:co-chaperonin GroES (HSP10)
LDKEKFSRLIVVGDRVLIKPKAFTGKTESGLYLPPGVADKEKVMSGYVIKLGPGHPIHLNAEHKDEVWKENSEEEVKYLPLQAKEGDLAIFLRNGAHEIDFDGEKYCIVPQNAILLLERDESLFE